MSLNTFFLSIFAKNSRFGTDVQSYLRRFQILSIIYLNFSLVFIISGYEIVAWVAHHPQGGHVLTTVATPGLIISFIFLRKGKHHLSSISVLAYMHCVNFSAGHFTGQPMVALYALMLFPTFGFFLAPTPFVFYLNTMLCAFQCIHHIYKIQAIFCVTLNNEQAIQISIFNIAAFVCLGVLSITCLLQKAVERNLWQMAQSNFEKSDRLTKEVVQAAEAKDAFVSSLSHEIRNPLNSMTGSIEFLLGVVKDRDHLEVLKTAKLGSVILLNLVNNVLDAAKLKSEKMEVSYIETNFVDILRKVLTINSETLRRNSISAQALIDQNLPDLLWIDPARFLQILMNLISNALKFTPMGGKIQIKATWCSPDATREELVSPIKKSRLYKGKESDISSYLAMNKNFATTEADLNNMEEFSYEDIESHMNNLTCIKLFENRTKMDLNNKSLSFIKTEPWIIHRIGSSKKDLEPKHRGYLKVQFTDTGCGIPEDSIPKMFKMFSQAHGSAASPVTGGTGLGLWICKQLCQKMGGDITLYSKVNQGTTFVFFVPVNNQKIMQSTSINDMIRTSFKEGVRAMIVDDYSYNRDLHRLLLEREGVQVAVANNGKEALEKYKSHDEGFFDFILMDVQMPEMDGFTAAKLMREWEFEKNRSQIDIYFVSGEYYDEEEVMAEFKNKQGIRKVSGIRCLRKPIDVDMVKRVTEKYTAKPESGKTELFKRDLDNKYEIGGSQSTIIHRKAMA